MKRALAMALGAMMVAGSAAPATAASHVDFDGYYKAFFMNDYNLGRRDGDGDISDSYWGHRLRLNFTFTPTDEIQVHWRMEAPNFQRWGNQGGMLDARTRHIYGVIKQDWGTVTIGKINDTIDTYGLGTLGWNPATNWYASVSPFDGGARTDVVRYSNKWDNGFGILAQYEKVREDAVAVAVMPNWWNDADHDRFRVEANYTWDTGGAALGLRYDRNAFERGAWTAGFFDGTLGTWDANIPGFVANGALDADGQWAQWNGARRDKSTAWYLNPSFMQSWGDFSVHFEGQAGWGTDEFRRNTGDFVLDAMTGAAGGDTLLPFFGSTLAAGVVNGGAHQNAWINSYFRDVDTEGYAFYLDVDYNYGPGNVTLAGWWNSGTGLDEGYRTIRVSDTAVLAGTEQINTRELATVWSPGGAKSKSLVQINEGNFYPLVVAYQGSAVGWSRVAVDGNSAGGNTYTNGNAISMANNAFENYIWRGFTPVGVNGYMIDNFQFWNNIASTAADGTGLNFDNTAVANQFAPTLANFQRWNIDRTRTRSFNEGTEANHWAIALTGVHAFTDDITMNYGLAYLALNKPNYRVPVSGTYSAFGTNYAADPTVAGTANFANVRYTTQDKDLGFEIDLGFSFKLLDNLVFDTNFGYMFSGDAYRTLKGYTIDNGVLTTGATTAGTAAVTTNVNSVWDDAKDTYVWYNSLTFSF